jgi:hypothetical protein
VRRPSLLALAPLLLLGVVGCGSSVLTAEAVADGAADALEEEVGIRPEVSCPDDLDAEVGAEARCTLTAPGDPTEYGVTVTVTSVDGDDARFDVQVDDEPLD